MKKRLYEISIIMAIYNMEQYLDESIQSVLDQTIGINKIELILVNDGSQDASKSICEKYKKKYPQNIVYIEKENGGVSSARNKGLEVACGKYVNFMDSDDKLQNDACEKVLKFFKKNDTDVVAIPLVYFDSRNDNHALQWKFKKTRLINIDEEPMATQMSISSAFVRTDVAKKFRFQTELKYAEDAELLTKCILQKRCYGVISDTAYMYRYRRTNNSAMQRKASSPDYYLPLTKYLYRSLINYEKKLTNKDHISEYIENLILYDLKWKLRRRNVDEEKAFAYGGKEHYLSEVAKVLQEISDQAIIGLDKFSLVHKMFLFSLKYGKTIAEIESEYEVVQNSKKQYIVWREFLLSTVPAIKVYMELLNIENGRLKIEGNIGGALRRDDVEIDMIVYKDDGEENRFPVIKKSDWRFDTFALNQNIKKRYYFRTPEVDIKGVKKISFILKLNGKETKLQIGYKKVTGLGTSLKNDYIVKDGYMIRKSKKAVLISECSYENVEKQERKYIKELREINELPKKEINEIQDFRVRFIDSLKTKPSDQRIWVFMDRLDKADDNAEHLFKYAMQQKDEIEKYFVINKESIDYDKMKQYGPVVEYGSEEHKFLMMKAEVIISSQASENTYSPFEEDKTQYYRTFLNAKRVFLQHGIIKDDLSEWLHKYMKNLDIFVTSAKPEYDSIVNGRYGYDEKEVVLTGLARYDNLRDQAQKYILFMPTWDSTLAKRNNGCLEYNPDFKKSKLYEEVNGLLNNKEVNDVLSASGYKILFKPHPNMLIQLKDFNIEDNIILADENMSYQELFAIGKALITDYSSTFFDFAYLRKPVLYYQVRENHLDPGYFDFDTMGMGPVARDEESLVEFLKKYIQNDFKMEKQYVERVETFFEYLDHDNCKRTYEIMREKFN